MATNTTAQWHTFEDRQSANATTQIRDWARRQGWPTEYSRIGWTTMVAVQCTTAQWHALLTESGAR